MARNLMLSRLVRLFRSLLSLLGTIALMTVTFSYFARLQNTTVQPVRQIIASRGNDALTQERIAKFVAGKEQELRHVRVAVRLQDSKMLFS